MVISGIKKNRNISLGLQGGDKGCSCKYDGQGRLHFNAKIEVNSLKKKSSKLHFLW